MSFDQAKKISSLVIDLLNPKSVFQKRMIWKDKVLSFEGHSIHYDSVQKIHLFGVGKAASYEVRAWEELLKENGFSDKIAQRVSYTKRDHSICSDTIIQLEGDHPYMSEDNIKQTDQFIKYLLAIEPDDTLIFLLSGGASSLLVKPKENISFSMLQKINKDLVNSGLNINKMNAVRKSLSQVKNGGLLKFIQTQNIYQFVNCDIPDGTIKDVGSSPLFYSSLDQNFVNEFLSDINISLEFEKPSQSNPFSLISSSAQSLLEDLAKGSNDVSVGKVYDGSCLEVIEDIFKEIKEQEPTQHLSGGEGTIVIPKYSGLGGRSTHFVLLMATILYQEEKYRDYKILSIGTDGTDGPTDAAGAYIDYELFKSLDPSNYLEKFDSYHYFEKLNTLIKTGPTGTNVMDLRCIWR